jgi:4-amino-4-deoxy-L-arabinose transferase-like glycosyltransferase
MKELSERHIPFLLFSLWLVVTAYNIFKPYHIDDTAHLEIARWISSHPLQPMSGLLNWFGIDEPIYKTNQPHLYFYLLSFWMSVFGSSEPATHMFQSFFSLACVFLFYKLAHFYARGLALWLTAMLVLGPGFLVEQNLMADVPLLAIWLCFFYLMICEVDSPRQTRRYLFAALGCSAALLG